MSLMLCVALLGPALADKPVDPLVGKWVTQDKVDDMEVELTLEFVKDGAVKVEARVGKVTQKTTGKYKVLDADTVEMELKRDDKVQKEKSKFKVDGDRLTLTDANGKSAEYRRVGK
jgi:uncharacterized protein (TIGR03066 family)